MQFPDFIKKQFRHREWFYDISEDDPEIFVLNQDKLNALIMAAEYHHKGGTLRDAAHWVQEATGQSCNHNTVVRFYKNHWLKHFRGSKGRSVTPDQGKQEAFSDQSTEN